MRELTGDLSIIVSRRNILYMSIVGIYVLYLILLGEVSVIRSVLLHWADKTKYKMAALAIISLGVTVFTVTPIFASGKNNTEENKVKKRLVINGTAQMSVAHLKSLAAEKKVSGVDMDDNDIDTEVKRYLSGEVAYFYDKDRSDKDKEIEVEVTITEATGDSAETIASQNKTDSDGKSDSTSDTEGTAGQAGSIIGQTSTAGQAGSTAGQTNTAGQPDQTTIMTILLNSKADYVSDIDTTMQLDPEETLTKEQEEEVLSTVEIERYIKSNYSVLQQFTNESEYTTRARQSLISYAMQFVGNSYVWGGTSLTNGCDCSGFVQEVFRHFGIITGRTSRDQYANCIYLKGKEVMPGDLIFYADETGYINHVAIYAGNYLIVHAANRRAGIKVNRYDYKKPYAYGRFIAN